MDRRDALALENITKLRHQYLWPLLSDALALDLEPYEISMMLAGHAYLMAQATNGTPDQFRQMVEDLIAEMPKDPA